MACSRKHGRALCFCAQLEEEGGGGGREDSGDMRIADCLQEQYDGGSGRRRRAERRELVVSLPPPTSVSAGSPCDSYSPRTLLSRLLVSIQRPSPLRGGGDGGEGVGCRVLFPRRYGFSRRGRGKIEAEEEAAEEMAAAVAEQELVQRRPAAEVEERPPVASDADAGDRAVAVRGKSGREITMSSGYGGKKPNGELSLNLGMGVGMVFLLSRSATELNKMTALREQMEVLLRDIKNEVQKKDAPHSYTESNNADSSSSESHMNVNSSSSNPFRRAASRNPGGLQKSLEHSTCGTPARSQRCFKRNQMEAELEAELERLQITEDKSSMVAPNLRRMQSEPVRSNCSKSHDKGLQEEYEVSEEMSSMRCGVSARELEKRLNQLLKTRQIERIAELEASFNCDADPSDSFGEDAGELAVTNEESTSGQLGVPARELERKLYELLETKQQERIAELESALENAHRRLVEKEKEICRWRDTARLVSQRRDESLNR